MKKYESASEEAKARDFKSLEEVIELTGFTRRKCDAYFVNNPKCWRSVLVAASLLKHGY